MHKPSEKKGIDDHDRDSYCPTSIKDTIQWFPFFTIIEHTANILETNKRLIPSLLNVFAMFQLRILYDKHNEEDKFVVSIAFKCSNCNKDTGLHKKYNN